jgi:4-hydroxy-3-polyprenylbenzoate decarboxylase
MRFMRQEMPSWRRRTKVPVHTYFSIPRRPSRAFWTDVNVHDAEEAAWKALNHIDPQRDLEFVLGPVDTFDHASRLPNFGSKVGVDATRKWPEEGFTRPWPDEIRMSPDVKARVDRLWEELDL